MTDPRRGTDVILATRNRRRIRAARHLGVLAVLFGALATVGILAGGAALGRWDLPFVEDPPAAAAPTPAPSYTGPPNPLCGPTGTVPVADPTESTVIVRNATGRDNLAQMTADELAGRGFDIAGIEGARLVAATTTVRVPPGREAEGLTLAAHIGTPVIDIDQDAPGVLVILGTNYGALVPADIAAAQLGVAALPDCPGVVTPVAPASTDPSVAPSA